MANKTASLLPRIQRILEALGENLRLARLRRKLSTTQVAERAGMGRSTLVKIEQGHPGVGIGQYLNVLKVLGLEKDLLLVAKDDELGENYKTRIWKQVSVHLKEISHHDYKKLPKRFIRLCRLARNKRSETHGCTSF